MATKHVFQEPEDISRKLRRTEHYRTPDGADRFSSLHDNLIEKIFCYLSLRDAIRTSTLSRSWRVRWRSAVRRLDFQEPGLPMDCPESKILEENTAFELAVDSVLRSVTGPIYSFKIKMRPRDSDACLQRWMSSAVCAGATELDFSIIRHWFGMVISLDKLLLYWQSLKSLKLTRTSLLLPVGLPRSKGLTKLRLDNCKIDIRGGKLATLISNCPSLTDLELIGCLDNYNDNDHELEISSNSLRSLHIFWDDELEKVLLKNCPQLERAFIRVDGLEHGIDDLLYGPCTKLQFLDIKIVTSLPHDDHMPHRLRHELFGLRHLKLEIDLRTMKDLAEAFCLLRSSPSLTELQVSYTHHYELPLTRENEETEEDDEYEVEGDRWRHSLALWEEDVGWRTLTLNQLNSVVLECMEGEAAMGPSHLKFCEFILANSPVLEFFTVQISFWRVREVKEDVVDRFRRNLASFPTASQHVRIKVLCRRQ